MGKNHLYNALQRVVPKKHRKKLVQLGRRDAKRGAKIVNKQIDRIIFGKKKKRRR